MKSARLFDKLIKKPILMIGILMMVIFLFQLKSKNYFSDRYQADSCRSALVMLEKRLAKEIRAKCELGNLIVLENYTFSQPPKNQELAKKQLYTQLANGLMFVASNTLNESLERTPYVVYTISTDNLEIAARVQGLHLARMANLAMTEDDQKKPEIAENKRRIIAEHLHRHVQVQERAK